MLSVAFTPPYFKFTARVSVFTRPLHVTLDAGVLSAHPTAKKAMPAAIANDMIPFFITASK